MNPELPDEDADVLARLLSDPIDSDRYPLSLRVLTWKAIGDKLQP
jgi:hypothetical protein